MAPSILRGSYAGALAVAAACSSDRPTQTDETPALASNAIQVEPTAGATVGSPSEDSAMGGPAIPPSQSSEPAAPAPSASASSAPSPREATRPPNPFAPLERALRHPYMGQDCRPDSVAGWEAYPVQRCEYALPNRDGPPARAVVWMLNPSPAKLEQWIRSACTAAARPTDTCHAQLVRRCIDHSGGQFPVAGYVLEDIRPPDGIFEAYTFRDGIRVVVAGAPSPTTEPLEPAFIEASKAGALLEVFAPARLLGTHPEHWQRMHPGADVGTSQQPSLAWAREVRTAYQRAWEQPSNALFDAWARANPTPP